MNASANSLWDDVQSLTLHEALTAPATKPKRHTDWSNAGSFIDGGYLARIVREHCKSCGGTTEQSQGIFHVEIKPGAFARRLTQLPRGAQWPVAEALPLEVTTTAVDWCAACLRFVGFTDERPAQSGFVREA